MTPVEAMRVFWPQGIPLEDYPKAFALIALSAPSAPSLTALPVPPPVDIPRPKPNPQPFPPPKPGPLPNKKRHERHGKTKTRLLEALATGPASLTELTECLALNRQAVNDCARRLTESGLLTREHRSDGELIYAL